MEIICSNCLTGNNNFEMKCNNCGNVIDESLKFNRINNADFLSRFVATLIDFFIILIIWTVISFVLVALIPIKMFKIQESTLKIILYVFGVILMIIYNVAFEISDKQATIGKQLFKMSVGDSLNRPISLLISLKRNIYKLLTCLTLGVGYLIIIFHEHKQSLHDIIANTYVFRET